MLGLAFAEASRSQHVVEGFRNGDSLNKKSRDQKNRRRRRKHGKSRTTISTNTKDQYAGVAYQLVSNSVGKRLALQHLLIVNWDNHPVLDIAVDNYEPPVTCTKKVDSSTGRSKRAACEVHRGLSQDEATKLMKEFLQDKILVGHGLDRLLYALQIQHPWSEQRDTASYTPYMRETEDPLTVMLLPQTLDDLMETELKRRPSSNIQHRAAACMDLFKKARASWEEELCKTIEQKERQKLMKLAGTLDKIPEDDGETFAFNQDYLSQNGQDTDDCSTLNPVDLTPAEDCIKSLSSCDNYSFGTGADAEEDTSLQTLSVANSSLGSDVHSRASKLWAIDDDLQGSLASMVEGCVQTDVSSISPVADENDEWSGLDSASLQSSNTWCDPSVSNYWLPRQREESSHPFDQDEWLHGGAGTLDRSGHSQAEAEEEVVLMRRHLPSKLLNESSDDSDCDEAKVPYLHREESTHPVDSDEWLETAWQQPRPLWFRRKVPNKIEDDHQGFSFFRRKYGSAETSRRQDEISVAVEIPTARDRNFLSAGAAISGDDGSTPNSIPALPTRSLTESTHGIDVDEWLQDPPDVTHSKFSFFRKPPRSPKQRKSVQLIDHNPKETSGTGDTGSSSKFSFFRRKAASIPETDVFDKNAVPQLRSRACTESTLSTSEESPSLES